MEFSTKYPTGKVIGNVLLSKGEYIVGFALFEQKNIYYVSIVLIKNSRTLEIKNTDPLNKEQAVQFVKTRVLGLVNRHKYTLHQQTQIFQ